MSLLDFNDLLTKMFNKIQGDNKYLYITGDFNVNTFDSYEDRSFDTRIY